MEYSTFHLLIYHVSEEIACVFVQIKIYHSCNFLHTTWFKLQTVYETLNIQAEQLVITNACLA